MWQWLKGCKCFMKLPTSSLVQMKGSLRQIYPIPFSFLKKNCIGENIFVNLFFSNLNRICTTANLIQPWPLPHFHWVAKLVQIFLYSCMVNVYLQFVILIGFLILCLKHCILEFFLPED